MASLSYLWKNRARFSISSPAFYKAWAKRFLLIPELYKRNKSKRILVKQGAAISATAEIGDVKVNGRKENLIVGDNTFIGTAQLVLLEKIIIGNNVCINDGVILLTASHHVNDPMWQHKKAAIIIEDFVWVATNAIILPGVKIGKGSVIGAGAVVSRGVEPYSIVIGNPAQVLAKKRITELVYNPCELLASNLAWLKG